MSRLAYPIGVQSFRNIRSDIYIYVDKTIYIRQLLEERAKFVFLSRPRRFGKSLFMSTLREFFAGNRELFSGLAIADYEYDWVAHPVLHLDFVGSNYSDPDGLDAVLDNKFRLWEEQYGLTPDHSQFGVRFQNIIRRAVEVTGQKVVILIDEYDKPLLETVDKPELQERFRDTLRGVYGNLKNMDEYIRFAMLTGVTKFGHLSVFSDLNNLRDISMEAKYAGICGITSDELHENFEYGVSALAKQRGWTIDQAYEVLRVNYDGYHFSPEGSPDVYNPFSVINALNSGTIGGYWFSTGTPTFLVKMIRSQQIELQELDDMEVAVSDVQNVSFDMGNSLVPVLYQTGYLTIKGYDPMFDLITLGYPNREVRESFLKCLMQLYIPKTAGFTTKNIQMFYRDVNTGNVDAFMTRLKSFFADMNYDGFKMMKLEQHYQDVTYLIFRLLGLYTDVEYKTSSGRIDMVIRTNNYIYVFEFKLDKTPEEALAQIDSKEYMIPFSTDGRKLIKIGANFTSANRGIGSWLIG